MSRIRTIKPDFWSSEQVISCSLNARLLFIGMWNFCDDNGIHPASYMRLKAEIFPCDNFDTDEIKQYIDELIKNNLLHEYTVNDKTYWIVTGWKNHQKIDKKTDRHPMPRSNFSNLADYSAIPNGDLVENTKTSLRVVADSSPPEGKGKEGNGKDINLCEVKTSPSNISNSFNDVQEVFCYWQDVMNHPKSMLDNKRTKIIEKALKNYTVAELKLAIDGCANTPHNMGKNDNSQIYDGINLILRDADHIERFINNVNLNSDKLDTSNDWMGGAV